MITGAAWDSPPAPATTNIAARRGVLEEFWRAGYLNLEAVAHDSRDGSVMLETRAYQIERETTYLRRFQHRADEIAHLIVNTDVPWVDISIQIDNLREEGRRLFPLKMDLFEMVFVQRFMRLWRQWRVARG
jgi:hypothetical protein